MDSRKVRRKLAAIMSVTMVMTSVLPSYVYAASSNDWDDEWIYDEDAGYYDEDDDEYDKEYHAWLRTVATDADWNGATPSDATPSQPEKATPSGALLAAVKSFNSEFEFVDINGDVIEDGEKNIPETEDSFPYLSQGEGRTKGGIDLGSYGYVEKEYFISGNANIYKTKDDKLATASDADYVNRILVFQPEDPADFSGQVYVEILNASSYVDLPDIWRRSYDYFMREGCVYIGVTSKEYNSYGGKMQANGNVTSLKRFDPDRYDVLDWEDNGIIWDILGQIGTMVKSSDSPLIYDGEFAGDVSTYLIGQSQSGFYINTFSNNFNHANYLVDEEALDDLETDEELAVYLQNEGKDYIFDGFLNVVGGMTDTALSNDDKNTRSRVPAEASEVPFILLVGQNDYMPAVVRDDADEKGVDMYRHYMIAGAPHSCKVFLPDMIDEIQLRAGRPAGDYPAFKMDGKTGKPHTLTDLNMDVFVNAALENLHLWATGEQEAPAGFGQGDINTDHVDEFGNLLDGIVSPQISVPVATYYGGANGAYSTDAGSMIYLSKSKLNELYDGLDDYLAKYEADLDEMIADGWILPEDKDLMMEIAETEPVLGNPGRIDDVIEDTMGREVEVTELSSSGQNADGTGYSDTEYKISGEANVYGLVKDDVLYRRRMYTLPYDNYVRVCVPENFNNEIVMDLIFEGEGTKDVSEYMKAGKAYVGITADPAAAKAKGGSWDIMKYPDKPAKPSDVMAGNVGSRPESGLLWDIISQTVGAVKYQGLVGNTARQPIYVKLGADSADADYVYTYDTMFRKFNAYDVEIMSMTGEEKTVPLNSVDADIKDVVKTSGLWSDVIQYRDNANGPTIGATAKHILEVDGMYFKDSNNNGKLDAYEDWRNDPETRAADLVQKMTIDDKIGMMFNNSRGMGINSKKTDATGLLDETENRKDTSIFGVTSTLGTTDTIKELGLRHFILRQNPKPSDMASWINQMNMVAESTTLGIPVLVTSNSRNENGQMTFGMNDASGVFSTWPGTMGLAAAAKGDGSNEIFTRFAEIARSEWDACGLKKGYMYMVDTMTDPRWQRTYGTFGEDVDLIADAAGRLVDGFQGSADGVQPNGVALTIKHFPGGGARENGFDPHYAAGQWNVYQTEDSLQKYHLPGFKAAVDHNVSSIMPYYAKPAALKSATQYDNNGKPISMQAVGFAFNKAFIKDLLRDQMGHKGYINSDSGIINNMAWGVEELDVPERAAYAINAGTDIIGDTNDVWSLREAFERSADGSKSNYYDGKEIPYGFTKDEVSVTEEALNTANERLLKEMFELGLFENPYRQPETADKVVDNQANWDEAYEAHQKSVVLLKNSDDVLPLTVDKLSGKKVYVEYFAQKDGTAGTQGLKESLQKKDITLTDDYNSADYAILFVNPSSGNYFSATQGYLELDICDGKVVHDVDSEGRPAATTHEETTLKNAGKIKEISDAVKANGGKVVTNVNFTLAWMLGNVEPYSDAVLAGFDTYADATMDVIFGKYAPTGKMPITLPKDDSVIAVNADGVCISPNDIPGYLKDNYMPMSMKDENGKAYAYRDADGNYYEMNFGLTYDNVAQGQKWSDVIEYKENSNGPTIGATAKNILVVDGMYFKDSNGNGRLDVYEDWRRDSEERADDLVAQMSIDDKIGMMFNNSRGMGINSKKTDATGLLDETENLKDTSIFGVTSTYGTTATIKKLGLRHFILRQNPEPEDMASWINQMNMVAESTALGIPVLVTSNSRNENGKMTFGMNDASGVFSTWPGTMGLAAAAKGNGSNEIFTRFAEIARSEWDACGLKKGYMYMVDTMTDPRWQRTYGTFGEDVDLIADAAGRLVDGFQGSADGVQPNGVALTIKHFPGGGARENGFDPHYAAGQWNVYQTEDSLQKYHLPGFKAAVDHNVSSIMPYYAKPAALKSATQYDNNGKPISMQAVGFAFNKAFIKDLLRDQMGHKGYINSDSGIINNMAWGVEELDVPERAAYAINAGTDIIGDTNDVWSLREAFERSADGSKSNYYDGKTIPYGFTKEEVTVTEKALDKANRRLLKEMFDLGLFENPYRDPAEAKTIVDNQANWDEAYEAHQQSVVMLKNDNHVLPLTEQKLAGKSVYVEYFDQTDGTAGTAALRENLKNKYGLNLTDDYYKADYAILFVDPSSGNYFSATQGYLELDICEDKVVHDVDDEGRPVAATHKETTLKNADRIKTISAVVRRRGGKVISNVNFTLAWMLGNVEPYSDALLAGFDTYADATMDVIMGTYNPTGKMPITLPKDDSVIAVDADGVCISRNDIPGYLKDNYLPDSMKDENGKAYAYRDRNGNYYEMNFGLAYTEDDYNYVPGGSKHHSSGGGSGSGGTYIRANATSGNWVLDEKGWWFKFNDGTWPADKWMYLEWNGRNDWYFFNPDGHMATGWLQQDGMSYYLHNVSDGTMGHMYTGWHQIDGKWYFFNEVSDGTKGKMLVNTTTPDGYQVGADGVWIQ